MKFDGSALIFLAVGLSIGTLLSSCPKAPDMEEAQYCDLVALHKRDPTLGWPDYRGTFDQLCTPEGKVKDEDTGPTD